VLIHILAPDSRSSEERGGRQGEGAAGAEFRAGARDGGRAGVWTSGERVGAREKEQRAWLSWACVTEEARAS
jgi:hypothetical protein